MQRYRPIMMTIAACGLTAVVTRHLKADDAPAGPPLTAAAGTSYQIESVARPGRLVRPEDADSRDGTPIVLYPQQSWKCMTWKCDAVPGAAADTFKLVNHFTHKTLAPESAADPSPVVERPAKGDDVPAWHFAKQPDGTYAIEQAGRALTADDAGHLTAAKFTGSPGQKWRLLAKPEHFTG